MRIGTAYRVIARGKIGKPSLRAFARQIAWPTYRGSSRRISTAPTSTPIDQAKVDKWMGWSPLPDVREYDPKLGMVVHTKAAPAKAPMTPTKVLGHVVQFAVQAALGVTLALLTIWGLMSL